MDLSVDFESTGSQNCLLPAFSVKYGGDSHTRMAKVAVPMAVKLEATSLQWSSARASMESERCLRAVQRKYRMTLAREPSPRIMYMAMDRWRSGSSFLCSNQPSVAD